MKTATNIPRGTPVFPRPCPKASQLKYLKSLRVRPNAPRVRRKFRTGSRSRKPLGSRRRESPINAHRLSIPADFLGPDCLGPECGGKDVSTHAWRTEAHCRTGGGAVAWRNHTKSAGSAVQACAMECPSYWTPEMPSLCQRRSQLPGRSRCFRWSSPTGTLLKPHSRWFHCLTAIRFQASRVPRSCSRF